MLNQSHLFALILIYWYSNRMSTKVAQIQSQQQTCLQNIASLQQFYSIKSHQRLISTILDRKLSRSLLKEDSSSVQNFPQALQRIFHKTPSKDVEEKKKIAAFAQKYSYEKLCQKFTKPRGVCEFLKRIVRKKLKEKTIGDGALRRQLWMLVSGAKFYMGNNPGLYHKLCEYQPYPECFDKSIEMDLRRTKIVNSCQIQRRDAMRRLLKAISRRNPCVGYCQGLNYIANYVLSIGFTEEQAFWLVSQIMQTIIPMDYYTNMLGLATDQSIFCEILKQRLPKIGEKISQVGLNAEVFSIQWFVCLFTATIPAQLVGVVWDRLLVEGVPALLKTGIILLEMFQEDILAAKQFPFIIWVVENGCQSLTLSEEEFNQKYESLYISRRGLTIAHQLYRELIMKQRLADRLRYSPKLIYNDNCSRQWPICTWVVEKHLKQKEDPQVWVFRGDQELNFIKDYLDNMEGAKSSVMSKIHPKASFRALMVEDQNQHIMMGRMEHICSLKEEVELPEIDITGQQYFVHCKGVDEDLPEPQDNYHRTLSIILEQEDNSEISEQKVPEGNPSLMPSNGMLILKKSQSVSFYKTFRKCHRELADIMKDKIS